MGSARRQGGPRAFWPHRVGAALLPSRLPEGDARWCCGASVFTVRDRWRIPAITGSRRRRSCKVSAPVRVGHARGCRRTREGCGVRRRRRSWMPPSWRAATPSRRRMGVARCSRSSAKETRSPLKSSFQPMMSTCPVRCGVLVVACPRAPLVGTTRRRRRRGAPRRRRRRPTARGPRRWRREAAARRSSTRRRRAEGPIVENTPSARRLASREGTAADARRSPSKQRRLRRPSRS